MAASINVLTAVEAIAAARQAKCHVRHQGRQNYGGQRHQVKTGQRTRTESHVTTSQNGRVSSQLPGALTTELKSRSVTINISVLQPVCIDDSMPRDAAKEVCGNTACERAAAALLLG